MFGFLDDVVDIADSLVTGAVNEVDSFVRDPIGRTVHHVTSPIRNAADVIEGLSEGELRLVAAAKLGADVASGMAISEILDYLSD